jgi:hypothetical protein
VPFLHGDAVVHELDRVLCGLFLLDQAVDNHPAHRDPEFVKPVDEARNHCDGQAFGQGHEEKGRPLFVGEDAR